MELAVGMAKAKPNCKMTVMVASNIVEFLVVMHIHVSYNIIAETTKSLTVLPGNDLDLA